jgi:16S rRNA (guanine527-N7)-methyltransferase
VSWEALLAAGQERIPLGLEGEPLRRLARYLELLDRWNRAINLTALSGSVRVERLVLEPLWVASELGPLGRYLDIGSGNGSPAIPWSALCPFGEIHVVEARQRRATFLRTAFWDLGLSASVHGGRFEDLEGEVEADWVTLQGVRLDGEMLGRIRRKAPQARVVWLTRGAQGPVTPDRRLRIPGTDREALVFEPDRTSAGCQGGDDDTHG